MSRKSLKKRNFKRNDYCEVCGRSFAKATGLIRLTNCGAPECAGVRLSDLWEAMQNQPL